MRLWSAFCLSGMLIGAAPLAAASYKVVELQAQPGYVRGAVGDNSFGLNNAGQSVGRQRTAGPIGDVATVWNAQGQPTALATPQGAWYSKADGINNAGVISGDIGVGTAGDIDTRRAARWTSPTTYEFFLEDNGHFSTGDLINDNGWIAGIRYDADPTIADVFTGYIWSPDGVTRWIVPALANGQIEWSGANNANGFVGAQFASDDGDGSSFAGVLWTEADGLTVLPTRPGYINTWASAINDAGIIVGNDWDGGNVDTMLWWDSSRNIHTLGFVPGTHSSIVNAMNNAGLIAGWSMEASVCDGFADIRCRRASLFDLAGRAVDINTLIDPGLGYTLLTANDINDHGDVYGEAMDADGRRFLYYAQAVPEPASWAMMVAGFAMVGGALRRRTAPAVAA